MEPEPELGELALEPLLGELALELLPELGPVELEPLLGELELPPEALPSGADDVAASAAGAIRVTPATAVTSTFTRRLGVCRIMRPPWG